MAIPEYRLTDLNNSGSDCYEKTANWLNRIIAENQSFNGNVQVKVTSAREVPPYNGYSFFIKPDVSVYAVTDELTNQPTDMDDSINQPTDEDDLTNKNTTSLQCNHKSFILVVSNSDFIGTVRKLYFDLTLQLIYISRARLVS